MRLSIFSIPQFSHSILNIGRLSSVSINL
jgi:hypothetical protein